MEWESCFFLVSVEKCEYRSGSWQAQHPSAVGTFYNFYFSLSHGMMLKWWLRNGKATMRQWAKLQHESYSLSWRVANTNMSIQALWWKRFMNSPEIIQTIETSDWISKTRNILTYNKTILYTRDCSSIAMSKGKSISNFSEGTCWSWDKKPKQRGVRHNESNKCLDRLFSDEFMKYSIVIHKKSRTFTEYASFLHRKSASEAYLSIKSTFKAKHLTPKTMKT